MGILARRARRRAEGTGGTWGPGRPRQNEADITRRAGEFMFMGPFKGGPAARTASRKPSNGECGRRVWTLQPATQTGPASNRNSVVSPCRTAASGRRSYAVLLLFAARDVHPLEPPNSVSLPRHKNDDIFVELAARGGIIGLAAWSPPR